MSYLSAHAHTNENQNDHALFEFELTDSVGCDEGLLLRG